MIEIIIGCLIVVGALTLVFVGIPILTLREMEDAERNAFDGLTLEEWLEKRKNK